MKRFIRTALLLSLAAILLLPAACGKDRGEPPPTAPGPYSADRELSAQDLAVFTEVLEYQNFTETSYEPLLVSTQVVAGTNYRFTATATPADGATPYTVFIYISQLPDGGRAELIGIAQKAE
ncbi:MAG: hypothetical protein FWH26_03365 [Oscillospiraceae bacterium]|nr:hypothetical protein [Oscillospiraceae bacterium]